jgi:hypothetical protein
LLSDEAEEEAATIDRMHKEARIIDDDDDDCSLVAGSDDVVMPAEGNS